MSKKLITTILTGVVFMSNMHIATLPVKAANNSDLSVPLENIVYVSPNGNAENADGTIDDPFSTVEAARDYLRTKDIGKDSRGIIYLREGTYHVTNSISLTSEDSYVTYAAYKGESVEITGSATLENGKFKKLSEVSGEKYSSQTRLPSGVADKVYVYDLGAAGCYDAEGNISTEGVKALTRHLIAKGVKGVYVGGSSGECIYQHVDERKAVLEAVMSEAKGKLTVIAHVGCNNTADSVELARHAESVGVDAIASIPPIYFHLPEYAIAKYWNDMSAAAPNTEFVIYNIPQLAGTGLTMSLLKEMLKNPNVIAVKNSSMPTQDIQMFKDAGIAARGEGNFVVFNGPDEQFVSGRVIGADGGIGGTYAVMPELYLAMNDHINKGEIKQAQEIQYEADRIIYKMCEAHGNLYAVQKEILRRMYGLELGGVREPMPGLIPEDEAIVAEAQAMIEAAIAKL